VAWFINGVEVHRQTGPHIAEMDKECKLMMNVWQPSDHSWAGPFDKGRLPIYVYYDWVSYAAHTPGAGNTGSNNDFTHTWRDELDAHDSRRWSMATHTWDENNVDFNPANVVFRDGKMILCMTESSEDKLGFQDNKAPEILHAEYLGNQLLLHMSEPLLSASFNKIPQKQKFFKIKNRQYHPENFILALELQRNRKKLDLNLSGLSDLQGNQISEKIRLQNIPSVPEQFPLMINVGGPDLESWQASSNDFKNAHYSPSGDPFTSDITIKNVPANIPAEIFQSGINDILRYSAKVPNGKYQVTLLFSEHLYDSPAQRIFDIYIEKEAVHKKLDLSEAAGFNVAYTIESQPITVNDFQLDIYFYEYNWSGALLNGLIIEKISQ
jgi:hypothetical protein